jgi:hypothetical protein
VKTPAALVCHLAAHLHAAWTVAEMPRGMRRRYGARLTVGDCHLYVAATRSAVDVVGTDTTGIDFTRYGAPPSTLLGLIRNAAAAIALDPTATPEWAKVTT